MTILFLDLETTGLDPKRDRILEVAAIATDDGLSPYGDFESVVRYDPETAPPVDARVVVMHARNDLWPCCLHERATPIDAVDALLAERVLRWSPEGPGTTLLAGNSIHFDRSFMVEYMPKTLALLHYRQIDVSSLNEMAKRFWPDAYAQRPAPQKVHRAYQDALESLATARHYANHMKVPPVTDLDLYDRGSRRPRIYVSGPMAKAPYTGPRAAFLLAKELWQVGWHPIVPHANMGFELAAGPLDPESPDRIGGWLEYDFSMMTDCPFIVRVTREGMINIPSSGTDREHAVAAVTSMWALTEEEALKGAEFWRRAAGLR